MSKLLVVEGPDRGKEFLLEDLGDGSHIAGRDPRHPIAIIDSTVSREHFRIERLPRGYRIVDLGSRNRTFINGEPVRDGLLRSGDVIAVGDSELRYEDDSEEIEVAEMASTILKEYSSLERSSIERIIDSLRSEVGPRKERFQRAVEGLRRLLDISREMMGSTSVEELYQKFLEVLVPALEADTGVVMVPEGGSWSPAAVHSPPADADAPAATGRRTLLVSQTVIRRVAGERTSILSRNAPADGRLDGGSIADGDIATVIAAPICRPGSNDTLAVLYADRRGSRSPFTEAELDLLSAAAEQAGGVLHHVSSSAELREANRNLLRGIAGTRPIIGTSRALEEIQSFIRKAAPTSMTVLIRGETGTGKELVASAIHYQSPRQGRPFVAINCAALPENLLESELFGHEKGAFTGAVARKKGRFELADTGTIFLDEIAELSPGCQAKLLRLLEERRFERVGGTEPIAVDVRVIAATNRDLATAIEEGAFREDLFYRLNVLAVSLPPLRTRTEDIPLLVRYFLAELGFSDERKILSPAAERKLTEYSWPGNIRQLRNALESAVVLREGAVVEPEDLVLPEPRAAGESPGEEWRPESLEEVQRRHVLRVLEHTGGNKKRAAEILGIERCTLYSRLRSYGIGSTAKETDT